MYAYDCSYSNEKSEVCIVASPVLCSKCEEPKLVQFGSCKTHLLLQLCIPLNTYSSSSAVRLTFGAFYPMLLVKMLLLGPCAA